MITKTVGMELLCHDTLKVNDYDLNFVSSGLVFNYRK